MPFKAFPPLMATDPTGEGYVAGESTVVFTGAHKNAMDAGHGDAQVYAVFYSGLEVYYVAAEVSGDDVSLPLKSILKIELCLTDSQYTAMIPGANYAKDGQAAPAGQVYVVLSTADGKDVMSSDETTVSGVGILEVM